MCKILSLFSDINLNIYELFPRDSRTEKVQDAVECRKQRVWVKFHNAHQRSEGRNAAVGDDGDGGERIHRHCSASDCLQLTDPMQVSMGFYQLGGPSSILPWALVQLKQA